MTAKGGSFVRIRPVLATMAVVAALSVMVADVAEARRGMSAGSRGTRTMSAPPPTTTAPNTAPLQRSSTPQTAPNPGASAMRPQPPRSSFFGSGLAGGLMRGLLIGGLIGMLMGHGLGGFAGLLGLLLQGAVLALIVVLALRFFRRRQPVPAGAAGAYARAETGPGGWPGAMGGGVGARPAAPQPPQRREPVDAIGIAPVDLDAFERLLGDIQTAFGREDEATLRARTTPEVFDTMSSELAANAARGVRNTVSDVKLLQGDLAESWREGGQEYATVAIRYESRDQVVDRATGRFLSGDRDRPGQSTEVWTFVREAGSGPAGWRLSAMQEA